MDLTIIILSGGKSSRMGQNKAFLQMGNKTEIEHLVELAKSIANRVIVVVNDLDAYRHLDVKLVKDFRKNIGPLAGIEAGLTASDTEINFVMACDMPFVHVSAIHEILLHTGDFDAVIPLIKGQRHPLFAVYRKSVLSLLSELIDEGNRKILALLERVKVNWLKETDLVSFDEKVFFNMNYPADYEEAKRFIENNEAKND